MKMKNGKYSILFLIVVSVFSFLFVGYLCYAKSTLTKSQECIIKSYTSHLEKVDNMYINLYKHIQRTTDNTIQRTNAIVIDSIINNSIITGRGLTANQYKTINHIISSYFESQRQASDQFSAQIRRDSLILEAERLALNGQVKNHLDLHLNQIENDYTSITIWAAVLTIVFLIFGFYSMFKMEHLIEQGEKSNEAIGSIKNDCAKYAQEIERIKTNLSSQCDEITSTFSGNLKARMDSFNQEINSRLTQIDTMLSNETEILGQNKRAKTGKPEK